MKVLAIDGGGIRGLIPALVLAEIERRTSRRMAELVDLIAGTSTGGILACALAKPDPMPAAEIADIYVEEGPRIFDRSLLKQVTSLGGLARRALRRQGPDARARALPRRHADARRHRARCCSRPTTSQARGLHFLRSEGENSGATMVAGRARDLRRARPTSSRVRLGDATLVDGGVFAINPALCAYAEVGGKLDLLLSLGHRRR